MRMRHVSAGLAAVLGGCVVAACSSHSASTPTPSADGEWASFDDRPCPPASILSYENFGGPFFLTWCTGCHSASLGAGTRQGAPLKVNFDTLGSIRNQRKKVWDKSGDRHSLMPPAGGPSAKQRALLGEWLACNAPSERPGSGEFDAGGSVEPPSLEGRTCAAKRMPLPAALLPRCASATKQCIYACGNKEDCRKKCLQDDPTPAETMTGYRINCDSCTSTQGLGCSDAGGCHSVIASVFCCLEDRCPSGSAADCLFTKCGVELESLFQCIVYVTPECYSYTSSPLLACFANDAPSDAGPPPEDAKPDGG